MRAVIAFLTRFLFRSRVGLAILLLVVVVSVIGIGQVVGPGDGAVRPPLGNPGPQPALTIDPTAGDDGIQSVAPPPDPVTSPGAPDPQTVAMAFATEWIRRDLGPEQWHRGLRPYVTAELAEKLVGVDPVVVPAERLTGEPAVVPYATNLVEVVIDVDSGLLRLRLTGPDGIWLVDGVDWERG
ncbi:hypothetical protein O7623_23315 [Solwaraspora sp. WMMD791]|uniref:hypothetical protein n=1 Tax=Solwaraspora sp. WMMD791 TaxID=3016086 RepID=UPI00249ABD6A|nr:hypothetical protein [Solwaraspora sp. WMMD791]WFE26249.1 hypothetical protein O7623_23315 [Solwaraspora sp. WMMD791]